MKEQRTGGGWLWFGLQQHLLLLMIIILQPVVQSHIHLSIRDDEENIRPPISFPSVAYFDFAESGWEADIYLNGLAYYYDPTPNNDTVNANAANHGTTTTTANTNGTTTTSLRNNMVVPLFCKDRLQKEWGMDDDALATIDDDFLFQGGNHTISNDNQELNWLQTNMNPYVFFPKIVITSVVYSSDWEQQLSSSTSSSSIQEAVTRTDASFLVLILSQLPWKDKLRFWWSQDRLRMENFQSFMNKEIIDPNNHNNNITKDSGNRKLNLLVVWEKSQEFQTLLLTFHEGCKGEKELADFGFDDHIPLCGRDFVLKMFVYMIIIGLVTKWLLQNSSSSSLTTATMTSPCFQLLTSEDLGRGTICTAGSNDNYHYTTTTTTTTMTEEDAHDVCCCSICLETMPIGTIVCILPCRHSFHPQCIDHWFQNTAQDYRGQYSCPLCKMDLLPYFQERVQARRDILEQQQQQQQRPRRIPLLHRLVRGCSPTTRAHENVLLDSTEDAAALGDLELTEQSI